MLKFYNSSPLVQINAAAGVVEGSVHAQGLLQEHLLREENVFIPTLHPQFYSLMSVRFNSHPGHSYPRKGSNQGQLDLVKVL